MSELLFRFRNWLQQNNHATWLLFAAFTLLLFIKSMLFHWAVFHSIPLSSLWHSPLYFYTFYMAKLLMPLFLAGFLFISKHRWWTIIISILVDLWCTSNLIYYKTYNAFLTVPDILLIRNMDGAWSSIIVYFDIYMVIMLLMSVIWAALYFQFRKYTVQRKWFVFAGSLIIIFILAYLNTYLNNNFFNKPKFCSNEDLQKEAQLEAENYEWVYFAENHGRYDRREGVILNNNFPFYEIFFEATGVVSCKVDYVQYTRSQSILSDFIAINIYHIFNVKKPGKIISLSNNDIQSIKPFLSNDTSCPSPQSHLIVILVESFEDWPLHHSIENQVVAPFLQTFKNNEHVLYCSKITSQALEGESGDGQMIINSGLLPIQNGVACMHYGDNIYPNFAHFYSNSCVINPFPQVWNQDTMSVRYSYSKKIEPEHGQWEDAQILNESMNFIKEATIPSCMLAITISTHTPFNQVKNAKIETNAPNILNRYMKCYNYTDSCISSFMGTVLSDSLLAQSTVVITGDHIIFQPAMLTEFADYAKENDLSIANGENYCPLIIYSPMIKENKQIDEVCYQMDIFPTILHLIGCENYYWKGFGVNLLDDNARQNRPVSEHEAYRLSDLMIRSDYFRQYYHVAE